MTTVYDPKSIEASRFTSHWTGQECICGGSAIAKDDEVGLHDTDCPAMANPGTLFMQFYEGCTFSVVQYMAPHLIVDRGEGRPRAISAEMFDDWFGPQTPEGEPGLDPDWNMREGDHGHLSWEEVGNKSYFVEVV